MSVISSDLQPKLNNSLKLQGVHASQITGCSQFTSSLGSQSFSPDSQGTIEFTVQPNGFVDLASLRIEGKLDYTQGLRLTKSGQSIIEQLQIYSPLYTEKICDIKGFNILQSALSDLTFSPLEMENGSLTSTQLYGTDAAREQYYPGVSFSFQFNHDFFKLGSLWPSWLSAGLKIKLTLAQTKSAFMKVGAVTGDGTFNVRSMVAAYDVVSTTNAVEQQYNNAWANNALQFKIPTWRWSTYTSNSQVDNLRITNTGNSNRALLVIPRDLSVVNSAAADSHGYRTAKSLKQLSVKVGDSVARQHDTTGGAASLVAALQTAIDHTSANTCINFSNYHCPFPATGTQAQLDARSNKFVLLFPLELDQNNPSVISGISRQEISVYMEYADPLPGKILYSSYILIDQMVTRGKDVGCKVLS